MQPHDLEKEVLKLDPSARAWLAERLLHSLEALSDVENDRLWAEEAQRRDDAWDDEASYPADDVLREARARLV